MEPDGRIGVLHVISGLELGGAEKMLLWSARYHDRKLIRMGVVSLMSGGVLAEEIRREKVEVYELGQVRGRLSMAAFRRLLRIIRDFDPRILQGHMFHSNILVRIAGGLRRQMVVLSTRHIDSEPRIRRFVNSATGFLNGVTLVFSPRVLAEEGRENLFKHPIRLIQYGIETPEDPHLSEIKGSGFGGTLADELKNELGIGPGTYIWISVGRLTRQKGLVHLLDAFSRLHRNNGDSVLLIVGDGEDRKMLNKRASDLGINDRVIFAGARQDTFALMGISDAFVLSSLWEGGPLVILEAMAAGLPVVSTKVGDAPFMVQQGRTGTLVDPGDVRQLADAMALVEGMGPEAAVWGLNGRRKVEEHYDFKRVQKEMELFYQELAGQV